MNIVNLKNKMDLIHIDEIDFKEIVNDVIKEDARKEALDIINKSSDKIKMEFYEYYKNNNLNSFCLHLDFVKYNLVKEGKIEQKFSDNFGDIDYIINKKS